MTKDHHDHNDHNDDEYTVAPSILSFAEMMEYAKIMAKSNNPKLKINLWYNPGIVTRILCTAAIHP